MFSSLVQALGVDNSFFIQFLVLLLFYPVLSRLLFYPYFKFHNQREEETLDRMNRVEKLKEKKVSLQEIYNKKAHFVNAEFNRIYQQNGKQIKESFLQERESKQIKIQKEYEEKSKAFFHEIKQAEDQVQKEVDEIAKMVVNRLIS